MESHTPILVGRYELHAELAHGGMAVVHFGRLRGDAGFARAIVIKRLHRQYVGDPDFTALLLDEARLASRLQHPNVVAPRDLLTCHGEVFVIMEYVHGLTIACLVREARARGEMVPVPVVIRVVSDVLAGLHVAHEARDGRGRPLSLVHRDVSPQNVMVGADGMARVLDFGIAHAAFRSQTTREGHLRAKLAYAAPEHILDQGVDRRADVYSSAIVCWELLTLERLFSASNESALLARVLEPEPQPAAKFRPQIPPELDHVLLAALSKDPAARPASAEEFALALERVAPPATHRDVARWVASLGAEQLDRLAARLAEVEAGGPVQETTTAFVLPSTETRTSERSLAGLEAIRTADPAQAPNLRRRWKGVHVAFAMGLALAALVVAPTLVGRPRGPRALASPLAASDPPPRAAAESPLPAARDAPLPDTVPASQPSPTATQTSAAPPPLPKAEKKPAVVGPAARSLPRLSPKPAIDDCSQLTEVDADGIHRVKRQCLR